MEENDSASEKLEFQIQLAINLIRHTIARTIYGKTREEAKESLASLKKIYASAIDKGLEDGIKTYEELRRKFPLFF